MAFKGAEIAPRDKSRNFFIDHGIEAPFRRHNKGEQHNKLRRETPMTHSSDDPPLGPARENAGSGSPGKPPTERQVVAGGKPPEESPDWLAQDWDDLMPRLHLLAIRRLTRTSWYGCRGSRLSDAAGDFVQDAITKTIEGVRVWDRATCTLLQHLAWVIVSDISHALNSSKSRHTVSDEGRPNGSSHWPPDVADEAPDQERIVLWRSELRRLLEYLSGHDSTLGRMAELMLVQDVWRTRDLSDQLGIQPAAVANLRKRLKRAVWSYLEDNRS